MSCDTVFKQPISLMVIGYNNCVLIGINSLTSPFASIVSRALVIVTLL